MVDYTFISYIMFRKGLKDKIYSPFFGQVNKSI